MTTRRAEFWLKTPAQEERFICTIVGPGCACPLHTAKLDVQALTNATAYTASYINEMQKIYAGEWVTGPTKMTCNQNAWVALVAWLNPAMFPRAVEYVDTYDKAALEAWARQHNCWDAIVKYVHPLPLPTTMCVLEFDNVKITCMRKDGDNATAYLRSVDVPQPSEDADEIVAACMDIILDSWEDLPHYHPQHDNWYKLAVFHDNPDTLAQVLKHQSPSAKQREQMIAWAHEYKSTNAIKYLQPFVKVYQYSQVTIEIKLQRGSAPEFNISGQMSADDLRTVAKICKQAVAATIDKVPPVHGCDFSDITAYMKQR